MNVALPLILAVASSLSFAVPAETPTDPASNAAAAAPQGQDGKKGKKDAEKEQKEHPAEQHGEWGTDHKAAMAAAKKEKKPVLMVFTGSDWCPPCKKLHAEVFESEAFKAWAKEKVVLLELDFPRNKEQAAELTKQNKELQKEFKVSGFPTVVVVNAKGKKLHTSVGYSGDGAEDWIKKVEKDIKKK